MTKRIPLRDKIEGHRHWWRENAETPYGYCWCGCGKETKLAPYSSKNFGMVKGQPMRYLIGHSGAPSDYDDAIEVYRQWWAEQRPDILYGHCWCGCGEGTPLARETSTRRNHIKGQPMRFVYKHEHKKGFRYTIEERGYETPCWVWQGGKGRRGYGSAHHEGRSQPAHRVLYELHREEIPPNLVLDHLCAPYGGPTSCVNPYHMEPVTQAENVRRSRSAQLDQAKVERMRSLHATGQYSYKELGQMFGVTEHTAYSAITYRRWA